jgi:hypothetical protein
MHGPESHRAKAQEEEQSENAYFGISLLIW